MADTATASSEFVRAAMALQPETIALRRAIHQEPEIGLNTSKTLAKVKAALKGFPLTLREARSCAGMIAVLEGAKPGRTVLLRGDMDALPMPEEAPVDFRSKVQGAMHACGHDAHTAMLVSAAKLLCARRDQIAGRVLFMFQPGEEGYHGARFMLDEGLLDDPKPDAAFAIHITPNMPMGSFSTRAGPLLASAHEFEIVVRGKGGHASMPHQAIDPTPVACEIALALHAFTTRRVNVFDPAVVTVSSIIGGTTGNVIPETVRMLGTLRTFSEATSEIVHDGVRRVAENVARAHDCVGEVEIRPGFPVTVNDPRAAALIEATVRAEFGQAAYFPMPSPAMGSEDFSYVLQRTPGAMYFLGVCPEGQDFMVACPCHSTKMELNEAAMAHGVALHCAVAERFLKEGFAS
ncbi:amidohydrolase [Sphingomonas sp. So64.6b]|uniref:M20 metallopeptidase family protein n=1 Tax=Sphingomonas sp. So64.6b TaxID=2997354 RepID=UPI0015FF2DD1|nr:M20 family metallopeptidase [Sphingomonas sp. So64.6b]QNA85525.1 amidohydrolase [Sphingomonas sp. So64.6b]